MYFRTMMKASVLIVMFYLYCSLGYSKNDSTKLTQENFEFYPMLEYGSNINNHNRFPYQYNIQNASIGLGISIHNGRIEFSYPIIQCFDSVRTFMKTYSLTLGYSFKTKSSLRIVPKINYMTYNISESRVEYETGLPNVNIPVYYTFEMEIKKITYSVGLEKRWKKHVSFRTDLGLSFFRIDGRTISDVDGSIGAYNHELSYPGKKRDIIKLFFGVGINYFIGKKS